LRIRFSGDQESSFPILKQFVAIEPKQDSVLLVKYSTQGFPTHSGLIWVVEAMDSASGGTSSTLPSSTGGVAAVPVEVRAGTRAITVTLRYERPPGEVRAAGELLLNEVRLDSGHRNPVSRLGKAT
jgi:hypothetical protein